MRQTYPYPKIVVQGYTDSVGTDRYNEGLSLARADAVRQWLMANGIPAAAITTEGFGKRNPVAANTLPDGRDNPEGRARNRRVVLIASPMQG
jgi:outer membrane protein OmpA-like peptidoglycan-associated protein